MPNMELISTLNDLEFFLKWYLHFSIESVTFERKFEGPFSLLTIRWMKINNEYDKKTNQIISVFNILTTFLYKYKNKTGCSDKSTQSHTFKFITRAIQFEFRSEFRTHHQSDWLKFVFTFRFCSFQCVIEVINIERTALTNYYVWKMYLFSFFVYSQFAASQPAISESFQFNI